MKQYCRYCNNLVTGNGTYCTAKNKEIAERLLTKAIFIRDEEKANGVIKVGDIYKTLEELVGDTE